MTDHYHYEVQGFNFKRPYDDPKLAGLFPKEYVIGDMSLISVSALTEEIAIDKAKLMLKKKYYRIGRVDECSLVAHERTNAKES